MLDLRPVGYVIGSLICVLGLSMLVPLALDLVQGNANWQGFVISAALTTATGGFIALACDNGQTTRLTLQQTFLLTTGVWLALPIFAALPFVFGTPEARYIDAFFEAMSGLTTTGATVFINLETLPQGLLLWRGLTQWFGGIGIIVVAMVFLPELRIGGMQIFRTEGFDTFGKILPRASQIAQQISVVYLALTSLCGLTYYVLGLSPFDAVVHAMTTVATGGFANYDASFGAFSAPVQFAGAGFMILAALPFVRLVQLLQGSARPLISDSQVLTFLAIASTLCAAVTAWQLIALNTGAEWALRTSVFNAISLLTGTGFASTDYMAWGAFPVTLLFLAGLVGGCAGSTACSIKVFRYQLLFASIKAQIRLIHSPHGVFTPRFEGRAINQDVLSSVMAFFVLFIVSLGVLSVLLGATGLDFVTSISGAAASLANIGPGLGPIIGPSGNYGALNDTAKWLLAAGMLIGRLELMAVYVLFTAQFWRG